ITLSSLVERFNSKSLIFFFISKQKQRKKLERIIKGSFFLPAGVAVFANHSKKMEGSLNGTLQDSNKVETQSLSQDKEVTVEVYDSTDVDIGITDEEEENKEVVESGKVEETQEDVSESVDDSFEPDAVKDAQVDNTVESETVELELKEDCVSNPDLVKKTYLPPSLSGNMGLRETEVVETIVKVTTVAEENNVLSEKLFTEGEEAIKVYGDASLPLTDVASQETVETSVLKSGESDEVAPTIIEKSLDLEPYLDEKVEEISGGQEESSYESAKESSQPLPSVVPDAENNENLTIVPVPQREYTSWRSCCGLFGL
ncbi:hypothetical protein CR513_16380, partial [Mucuna pruriens]